MRVKRAAWLGLGGVAAVVALLRIAGHEPDMPPPAEARNAEAPREEPRPPSEPAAPAASPRARAMPTIDWLGGGVVAAGAEERAARKPAYRGQLVVGAARRPLGHTALRLTFAWLDTALPEPTDDVAAAQRGEPPLLDWHGTTTEYGYFALPFVPQQRDLFLRIDPGGPADELLMLRRATWENETVDLGVIVLDERGAVRGRVLGPEKAINGARVRALDLPLTNAWVSDDARERALGGASLMHEHRLWLGARSIAALPRWLARRDAVLPFPEAETDGAGQFALRGVRPGSVQLIVQGRDGTELRRDVTVEPGRTTEVELVVPDAELATLRIEEREGVPAEVDVVLTERAAEDDPAPVHAVVPPRRAVGGELLADAHLLATGTVLVRRLGGGPWEPYAAQRAGNGFSIELAPLGAQAVRLQSVDGSPVHEARVRLSPRRMPLGGRTPSLPPALQPDEVGPGLWRATSLPIGRYEVLVQAPGFAPAIDDGIGVDLAERPPVELTLYPSFALAVRVLDGQGRAVPGAAVTVLPHDGDVREQRGIRWSQLVEQPLRLGTTGDDGLLQADGFWQTAFSFAATHPALGRGLATASPARPDAVVEIRLGETGGLLGVLTEDGGAPAETLLVRAAPAWEIRQRADHNRHLETATVRVDEDGRFTLRALWPGHWSLAVVRPHESLQPPLLRTDVWVHAGATELVELELPARRGWSAADVRGRVRLDSGSAVDLVAVLERPRADGEARVEDELDRYLRRRRAKTGPLSAREQHYVRQLFAQSHARPFHAVQRLDREGRFAFADVPDLVPLHLSIRREQDGRACTLATRAIPAERDRAVELEIALALGSLRVYVVAPDGPCRHRELRAVLAGSDPKVVHRAVADEKGTIELRNVPAGTYELQLGEGGRSLAGACTVVAGEDGLAVAELRGP